MLCRPGHAVHPIPFTSSLLSTQGNICSGWGHLGEEGFLSHSPLWPLNARSSVTTPPPTQLMLCVWEAKMSRLWTSHEQFCLYLLSGTHNIVEMVWKTVGMFGKHWGDFRLARGETWEGASCRWQAKAHMPWDCFASCYWEPWEGLICG